MKKCNSNLLFLSIGTAVGTVIGYIIASDKRDEIVNSFNDLVNKIKRNGKSSLSKGENILDELIDDEK